MNVPRRPWASLIVTVSAALLITAAAGAQTPSEFERGVLAETNLARIDPAAYAAYLESMLPWFDGALMNVPGRTVRIRTNEGPAAVREAIDFLRRQHPLPPLIWSDGLWRAARDHAADQARSGTTGHVGSDGSTMGDRLDRHGQWLETAAENIDYGSSEAREVIISLIIDDGVSDRGHRTTIFAPALRVMGAACGPHPEYREMCVIDYAGGFNAARR